MAKPRAYVNNMTIAFGPATTKGRLLPIRLPDRKPKFHYCTPDGRPVSRCYQDSTGKVYFEEDLGRAYEDEDGELVMVDKDTLTDSRSSDLPENVLNLTVHKTEDVNRFIFPSDNNAYIFDPVIKVNNKVVDDPANVQWYEFINTVVREPGLTFMGRCNLRNHEGLFRVSSYHGNLAIQKQLYPEQLNQYPEPDITLPAAVRRQALDVAKALVEDFDPESYDDKVTERVLTVLDGSYTAPEVTEVEESTDLDLSAALSAFLTERQDA